MLAVRLLKWPSLKIQFCRYYYYTKFPTITKINMNSLLITLQRCDMESDLSRQYKKVTMLYFAI